MKNIEMEFWYSLSNKVFVTFNANNPILLYHTETGVNITTDNSKLIGILNDIYLPQNLGVIDLSHYNLGDNEIDFIDKTVSMGIGIKIRKDSNTTKPINLIPILNLQNDIDKLISNNEFDLIGEHISGYLTTLNLYINNACNESCIGCENYYKQTLSCTKNSTESFLKIETIRELFDQASYTQTKRINILGGNIAIYPYLEELIRLLKEFNFEFRLWLNLKCISKTNKIMKLPFHKEVIITEILDNELNAKIKKLVNKNYNMTLNFIIPDEETLNKANEFIQNHNISDFKLFPYYNGLNINFIKKFVYLDESDILSEPLEFRKIFCNQKLNANYFGTIHVFSDGTVKSNPNKKVIGSFPDSSLLELTYFELLNNTSWRVTRNGGLCNKCIYRFLCPPPSNLEFVMNKDNLCNYKGL